MDDDLSQSEPALNSKPPQTTREKLMIKRVLLVITFILLVLWGIYDHKFSLRLVPSSIQGMYASEKQIEVHPEVLNLQESFARVAEAVKPAVVNISTIHLEKYEENPYEFFFMEPDELFEQFFNPQHRRRSQRKPQQQKVSGMGSGVIIDPDGYILTNEHVVRGADEIKVTLSEDSDKRYDGKVIGRDERTDLAVVKIKSPRKLPYAQLGDSDMLRVGDWAIAIGSPFGLEQTVTVGIISASRQNLAIEGRNYRDLIQTDAAINRGNSGGPLLNIRGEVIGINTAIYSTSGGFAGIGFAIPINRAKEIIPQLRDKGKVVRGWIGVELESKIDDATASVFGVPDKEGAMIRKVLKDYPAEKAGLMRGDIIREFAGKKVKSNYDLQSIVAGTPPDKKVVVKVVRNKKEMSFTLTISEAPQSMESMKKDMESEPSKQEKAESSETSVWLGATFRDVNSSLRERFSIPDSEKGVLVIEVGAESKSEEIGMMSGDLIREINQEPVTDIKTLNQIIKKVKIKEGVVLDILRSGEPIYLRYIGSEK